MTKEELAAMLAELGIDQTRLNGQSEALRKQGKSVEGLTEMLSAIVEKAEDGSYKLKIAAPAPEKKDDKTPEWQTELNAIKAELKKKDDLLAAKDLQAAAATKRSAIVDLLSKADAVRPDEIFQLINDKITQDSAGQYAVFSKDANGMDVVTPADAYVSTWLKDRPEYVRPQAHTGSGTPSGTGSTAGAVDLSDFAQYQKNRAKIASGEIKVF